MPAAVLDKLKIFPGVAAATPQFYLASLSTECCSERVQIIAYDPETDFLIKPWLDKAAVGALGEAEIVVGSKLNVEVGGQLYFFGVVHTVAARMEPTGMGLDTSVLMPLEGVRQIIGSVGDPAGRMPDPSAFISTVALKIEDGLRVKDVANAIMRAEAIEFGLDMVLPGAIVTETSRRLSGWSRLTGWLSAGLWLLALLSLALVFSVSAGERSAEFGIYRLLGATRPWLGRLLLAEAAAVAAAGALAGLVLAALVVFPFNALIFGALGLPALPLTAPEIALRALAGAALGVAVAPLASLRAVWRLTRVDVAGNLRSDA
jgi:putative ABC transport system permease protein